MSYYDNTIHCEHLDCVAHSKIGQTGYLLTRPRIVRNYTKIVSENDHQEKKHNHKLQTNP